MVVPVLINSIQSFDALLSGRSELSYSHITTARTDARPLFPLIHSANNILVAKNGGGGGGGKQKHKYNQKRVLL